MNFDTVVPTIERGLEVSQVSFSGGRTAVSLAGHGGLTQINYYGAQRFGDVAFYKSDPISAWSLLYRPCLSVDGELYLLELNDTSIYPFGYSSRCRVGGLELEHGMWLLNDAIVFTAKVLSGGDGQQLKFKLINTEVCTRIEKPTRTWASLVPCCEEGIASATVTDVYPEEQLQREREKVCQDESLAQAQTPVVLEVAASTTFIGIAASSVLGMREAPRKWKSYYETRFEKGVAVFSLAFGHSGPEAFASRLAVLKTGALDEVAALRAHYQETLEKQPAIRSGNPVVDSLFGNVRPIIDSLKVKDIRGALRAADSGYWVWGWDSMVFSEALGFTNEAPLVVDMLEFYRRTANPQTGIVHALNLQLQSHAAMASAPQCLYAVTLYNAYLFNGDKALLADYLPFARSVVDRAEADEVAGSGLLQGVSLYPDAPEDLEQDGSDLSVFNNSIYFQALKIMAELERELGDEGAASVYEARAAKTKAGFRRFYDPAKGYFVDSLSAKDFSPRSHYPLYAILWLTPFAAELIEGIEKPVAQFMRENFPARHGLRMFPKWDTRFMYDGCQLGMYMPVIENFHREVMKLDHDASSVKAMLGNIEWFWSQLCVPEAMSCEFENHGVTVDNPGRKQGFNAKAWLAMFHHIAAGINLSPRGIAFSACDAGDLSIKGLALRGKMLDIDIQGQGWRVGRLILNGVPVDGASFIPFEALKANNQILVQRAL